LFYHFSLAKERQAGVGVVTGIIARRLLLVKGQAGDTTDGEREQGVGRVFSVI
jgi:hypothetical protein